MEVSVPKCDSSEFSQKAQTLDLKSIYVDNPSVLDRKSSGKRENSLPFDDSRRKRRRKEASLSSFGPEIVKKKRNGLNASRLKLNGFSSGVGKPENLNKSTRLSDGLQNFGSDGALDPLKKNNDELFSIGNLGGSCCLSDGVIIPKKPRGILRQKKLDKLDSSEIVKDDSDNAGKSSDETHINALLTDIASPCEVSDGKMMKNSTEVRNELFIELASPSHISDCKGKKKSTEIENELSTDVASPSQVLCGKREKKSIDVKNEWPTGAALPSQSAGGKRKKKSIDVKNESSDLVSLPSQVLETKRKKKSTDVKVNGSAKESSDGCTKVEKHVRRRKKISTSLVREDHLENGTPLANSGEEFCGDFLEDDLEQNAARMLSSRFDPSCTGFSGNMLHYLSQPANGFHGSFKAQTESSLVDDVGRMLRPRKHNGKSLVRKRRHFYEVSYKDMDPYCILKQRIRVFWPLDKSWYFGLVKDYDPVTGLHHVKYDDRDEEWINLQNERFKLLLFPSEISRKLNRRKSQVDLKQEDKKGDKKAFDAILGNCTESEPIISWFSQPKHRRKLSAASMMKKTSNLFKDFESPLSSQLKDQSAVEPSILFPKLEETSRVVHEFENGTSFNDGELSFVYFRKKFHKRPEGLNKTLNHSSVHGCSAASFNILASVADSLVILEEPDIFGLSMESKQVTLKLSLPQFCIHDLVFGRESSLYGELFLIQFCKLANVWPMVHMDIVIVDNVLGLRLLSFEGSVRCVVVLLCLIIRSFCCLTKRSRFEEMQMPYTSIGINLSGLHVQGGNFLFLLYRFFEMESSKWRYLENKLKHQCVTIREIPVLECTSSTFKRLRSKSGQMFCSSTCKDAVSLEDFPERSYSDILRKIVPDESASLSTTPLVCFINENGGGLPPYFLSSTTAPSSILNFHIKSLIAKNATSVCFQKQGSNSSQDSPDAQDKLTINHSSSFEDPSDPVSDITMENLGSSLDHAAASSGKLSVIHLKVETDALSVSDDGDWMRSSCNSHINDTNISRNNSEKSSSTFPEGYSSPEKSEGVYTSYMNTTNAKDRSVVQIEEQLIGKEINGYSLQSANPTAPRSMRHFNGHNNSASPKYGHYSKLWSDDFMPTGFISGSKKPRTQVSYSLPFGGYDLGSKRRSHQQKQRSYKMIKTDMPKKPLGISGNVRSYHDQFTCNANVLVTVGDKGWRECGAQIVVESDDQKDFKICVKFSGVTKYVYKAQHILQPGITNRYTHAMMWKGGKDWALEFTDRNQWYLFKEIYEDCHNRNIRASYVKNIPIPGVRLIAGDDDNDVGVPFVRSSYKYCRQIGTEVDTALDPAHVLYDMDGDDEIWVAEMRNSTYMKGNGISEVTDGMFETVMDIFEKFAYAQQCEEFSSDEIEEFMADVSSPDIVKTIYNYWRQKRLKKGMPLIRQFQPPLWERYQQQLKEWESIVSKEKTSMIKKPPLFAFCLRPRGLEVPNKLLKQKSHKKLMSTGHHAFVRELDGFHPSGGRANGLGVERISIPIDESSDSYHSNDASELYRPNSKKRGAFTPPRDYNTKHFSHQKKSKKNGIYEPPNMSQIQRDGLRRHRADIDEFKLRDALNSAQHASNVARMKREKAQFLMHKADLALHKATVALMIAQAMKESEKDLICEGDDDD